MGSTSAYLLVLDDSDLDDFRRFTMYWYSFLEIERFMSLDGGLSVLLLMVVEGVLELEGLVLSVWVLGR